MIRIGDFARLAQVSIATLRHYDEIDLLKPVAVDKFTGYRSYSVSQLPRLNRILALKDLGFSLDQIVQALNGDLSAEQLKGMLKMKHAEAERQIAEEQARLARIAARIRQIELEDTLSDYDVALKTAPAMLIASHQVTIPSNDQVPAYLDMAYGQVYGFIKEHGIKDTGPCFAIWHQAAEVLANEVAEAAAPVDRLVPGDDAVRVYELPATQVASVVHHGQFENFSQAHTVLLNWVENNGYEIAGPYREIYINHNPDDMSEAATEIQYPVERANR